jgi:hypothetical protein
MRKAYFLSFLLIAVSCRHKVEEQIHKIMVNPLAVDSTCLSEISSSIDMVILETNESCLITGIQEMEKSSQYIFINDAGKRILQFDISGRFIRQIGALGRGPGEYPGIISIALDTLNSTIYVSAFSKILCYDFSGNFLHEIKAHYSEFILVVKDKLWTISTGIRTKSENNLCITNLIRYTLEGYTFDTIAIKKVVLPSFSGAIFPQAYYISDLEKAQYLYFPVLVPEPEPVLRDTLYEVKGNTMIPSVKLDFGKSGEIQHGKKQIFVKNIYRTNNYLFAEYTFKRKDIFFCNYNREGTSYNVNEGFTDDYFGTGIVILKPLNLRDETMYFVKESNNLDGKIEGVSENSNPVIFIVKLKVK